MVDGDSADENEEEGEEEEEEEEVEKPAKRAKSDKAKVRTPTQYEARLRERRHLEERDAVQDAVRETQ